MAKEVNQGNCQSECKLIELNFSLFIKIKTAIVPGTGSIARAKLTVGSVLLMGTFEAFLHGSILNKTVFCLEEKQGILLNNECSIVGIFKASAWHMRKQLLYVNGPACMA